MAADILDPLQKEYNKLILTAWMTSIEQFGACIGNMRAYARINDPFTITAITSILYKPCHHNSL